MAAGDSAIRTVLSQTLFGVLGNVSLLYRYPFLYCTGCRLRTKDLIVKNLIVANILVLFSNGYHNTMTNYGWHHRDSDFTCGFSPHVRGVSRGVSIGNAFLLSVFQAITICPQTSRWAELKVEALQLVSPSIILGSIANMLVNVVYPMHVTGNLSNKTFTSKKHFGHCSSVRHDRIRDSLYAALISFSDVLCFVVTILASSSTGFILYSHKQRLKNFHRIEASSISSPESRATKAVLLVSITFVCFNTLFSIYYIVLRVLKDPDLFIMNISAIITACFPTISPFLLMSRNSRISRLCFAGKRNTNSFTLMRKM